MLVTPHNGLWQQLCCKKLVLGWWWWWAAQSAQLHLALGKWVDVDIIHTIFNWPTSSQHYITSSLSNVFIKRSSCSTNGLLERERRKICKCKSLRTFQTKAKLMIYALWRPTTRWRTCVSPSLAGRRRSGLSSPSALWAQASPCGTSRGSSAAQCHYH